MNSMRRSVRAELLKLTTTRMLWGFLLVLLAMGGINAATVAFGTDMDGSKAFVSTAADQQSLIAFAVNATMIAGLFGAIAAAREYAHLTVIPTFLAEPHRQRVVVAQLTAIAIGGAVLGAVGAGITTMAVAAALPTTEYGFLVPALDVARVIGVSAFCGAAAAVLGAGIGTAIRNVGGAVTAVVLVLIVAPPMLVQLVSATASWIPASLALELSGVESELAVPVAAAALLAWAIVPAAIGAIAVHRRDVA
jgi:ABC-2 type transport system permease protein